MLAASVELGDGRGAVFTGVLSPHRLPWLNEHAVDGTVVLPGTAFVELALHAGHRAGCSRLAELTLETPAAIPTGGELAVQVAVLTADDAGHRTVSVHSRPADAAAQTPWTRHAVGTLTAAVHTVPVPIRPWPPGRCDADRRERPVRRARRDRIRVRAGLPGPARGVAPR